MESRLVWYLGDDKLSYIIFCIFFGHFSFVLIQIGGILEQLPMVYRIFYTVFISNHIIIVYPKPSNSLQNHANKKINANHEDLGNTMDEGSRVL